MQRGLPEAVSVQSKQGIPVELSPGDGGGVIVDSNVADMAQFGGPEVAVKLGAQRRPRPPRSA